MKDTGPAQLIPERAGYRPAMMETGILMVTGRVIAAGASTTTVGTANTTGITASTTATKRPFTEVQLRVEGLIREGVC